MKNLLKVVFVEIDFYINVQIGLHVQYKQEVCKKILDGS